MRKIYCFTLALLCVFGLICAPGCGSTEVTIDQTTEGEISPEEQQIRERLQQTMGNPLAPPPGVQSANQPVPGDTSTGETDETE